jgi:hypothetical protein
MNTKTLNLINDMWSNISLRKSFLSYRNTNLSPKQRRNFYLWALNYLQTTRKTRLDDVCICNLLRLYKVYNSKINKIEFNIYHFPELVQQKNEHFYWFVGIKNEKKTRIEVLVNALEMLEEYN